MNLRTSASPGAGYPRARDRFSAQHDELLNALGKRTNPYEDAQAQKHARLLNMLGAAAPILGGVAGAGIGMAVGGPVGAGLGMGIGSSAGNLAKYGLGEAASEQMRPQQEDEMRRAQMLQMLMMTR